MMGSSYRRINGNVDKFPRCVQNNVQKDKMSCLFFFFFFIFFLCPHYRACMTGVGCRLDGRIHRVRHTTGHSTRNDCFLLYTCIFAERALMFCVFIIFIIIGRRWGMHAYIKPMDE